MRARLHVDTRAGRLVGNMPARGVIVGRIGGLVGTIVMDLFGGVLFVVMGGPASLSFAIIGDAAAAFFVMHLVYGLVLGLVAYYGLRAAPAPRRA